MYRNYLIYGLAVLSLFAYAQYHGRGIQDDILLQSGDSSGSGASHDSGYSRSSGGTSSHK